MANEAVIKLEGRSNRRPRQRIGEVVIIVLVLAYAGVLLVGPLAAIVWGAFSSGVSEFFSQLTSPNGIAALQLTVFLATAATAINTVFGICIA